VIILLGDRRLLAHRREKPTVHGGEQKDKPNAQGWRQSEASGSVGGGEGGNAERMRKGKKMTIYNL